MTRAEIKDHITTLQVYLDARRQLKDWHAVRDACVDIEILEAILEATDE